MPPPLPPPPPCRSLSPVHLTRVTPLGLLGGPPPSQPASSVASPSASWFASFFTPGGASGGASGAHGVPASPATFLTRNNSTTAGDPLRSGTQSGVRSGVRSGARAGVPSGARSGTHLGGGDPDSSKAGSASSSAAGHFTTRGGRTALPRRMASFSWQLQVGFFSFSRGGEGRGLPRGQRGGALHDARRPERRMASSSPGSCRWALALFLGEERWAA